MAAHDEGVLLGLQIPCCGPMVSTPTATSCHRPKRWLLPLLISSIRRERNRERWRESERRIWGERHSLIKAHRSGVFVHVCVSVTQLSDSIPECLTQSLQYPGDCGIFSAHSTRMRLAELQFDVWECGSRVDGVLVRPEYAAAAASQACITGTSVRKGQVL